jgi:cardiolipin synthase
MISVLPNAITLSRLLSVPFLAIMLSSNDYLVAFWFFLALGLSDGLDGYIARRYDAITTIGILLDPVADKLLVITCASYPYLEWDFAFVGRGTASRSRCCHAEYRLT